MAWRTCHACSPERTSSCGASELNEFVKRLTALGTMLVTGTLIAGIYGMNFEHMPELGWRFGYPLVLALRAGCTAALGWWFHRKGWL